MLILINIFLVFHIQLFVLVYILKHFPIKFKIEKYIIRKKTSHFHYVNRIVKKYKNIVFQYQYFQN